MAGPHDPNSDVPLNQFLADRLGLPVGEMPEPNEWTGSGNTIGSVALRTGLLTVGQIDTIIEAQQRRDTLFGELAIEFGMLSESQLGLLLALQRFHRWLDLSARLMIEQRLELPALLEVLADFARQEK